MKKTDFIVNYISEIITYDKKITQDKQLTSYKSVFSNKNIESQSDTSTSILSDNYYISSDLLIIVKAALITGKPIFLRGAPGSGKTQLAKALASVFHGNNASQNYFEWVVKSYSKAKDGLYSFDHIRRLRDSTIPLESKNINDPTNYINLGPLGMAIKCCREDMPTVLLIDEIDKSDIDFGNDLLLELDEMRFSFSEMQDEINIVESAGRPLVIITSNDERTMSPAFIRRCIYYEIDLKRETIDEIIKGKLPSLINEIKQFKEVENEIKFTDKQFKRVIDEYYSHIDKSNHNIKEPSIAELIEWVKMLVFYMVVEGKSFDEGFEVINKDPLLNSVLTKRS